VEVGVSVVTGVSVASVVVVEVGVSVEVVLLFVSVVFGRAGSTGPAFPPDQYSQAA
jgi:hypothetical protein